MRDHTGENGVCYDSAAWFVSARALEVDDLDLTIGHEPEATLAWINTLGALPLPGRMSWSRGRSR